MGWMDRGREREREREVLDRKKGFFGCCHKLDEIFFSHLLLSNLRHATDRLRVEAMVSLLCSVLASRHAKLTGEVGYLFFR